MKNYYSTINDVCLTFSNIRINENGFETILARFERPGKSGFDYSEWKLPCICSMKAFGFSEDEIMQQERYLRNNAPLMWDIAREEMVHSA